MIRVVIGHHGKLVRGALAVVLSKEPDLTVVGEFDRADELLGVSGADVVVLDPLLLGEMGVAELCGRIAGRPLLMLVERDEGASISLALSVVKQSPKVGAIATDASPDDLLDAVRGVAEGRPVFDVSLALAVLRAGDNPLTERECEVLRLIGTGATARDVAATLCLSAGTVRNYLSRILSKTDARSRIEAIRKAQDAGWI